jgi:hypothetical protein
MSCIAATKAGRLRSFVKRHAPHALISVTLAGTPPLSNPEAAPPQESFTSPAAEVTKDRRTLNIVLAQGRLAGPIARTLRSPAQATRYTCRTPRTLKMHLKVQHV